MRLGRTTFKMLKLIHAFVRLSSHDIVPEPAVEYTGAVNAQQNAVTWIFSGVVNMNDLEPIANNWGRIRGSNKPGTITIYEAYTQIFEALKNQPSTHFTFEAIKWAASKLGISNYPVAYELLQNHPNPFNAGTMINFVLPYYHHNGTAVHLSIYNLFGQEIVSWKLTDISMGRHSISWNTMDKHGFEAASGLYLIHFSAGDYSTNRKMLLVR